ncbi:MAG TPA: (2Fe-2S)-binding protein [Thermoanaerobaculia bacterium]|nr:(2Fe-2S)-binding protein [Thermoanaerobaculia bacterium]
MNPMGSTTPTGPIESTAPTGPARPVAHAVSVTVNGRAFRREVEPRLLLSDFLRHELGLTGTHVGCEHGVCGACTVLFDGEAVRSCLLLAVQADGHEVATVEGLAPGAGAAAGELHPLQEAFRAAHGLQCGFCTPGFLMTLIPFLKENPDPSEEEIRHALSGNLCRCTGYQNIVAAVKLAARRRAAE